MKNKILMASIVLSSFAVGCGEKTYTPPPSSQFNTSLVPQNQPTVVTALPPGQIQVVPAPNSNNNTTTTPNTNQTMSAEDFALWNIIVRKKNRESIDQTVTTKPDVKSDIKTETTEVTTVTESETQTETAPVAEEKIETKSETAEKTEEKIEETAPVEKVIARRIKGDDAKALYIRLAKEEYETTPKGGLYARVGTHYICYKEAKLIKNNSEYFCDFDVRIADGVALQRWTIGKSGTAEIENSDAKEYKGKNLIISGQGRDGKALSPIEGNIILGGEAAKLLYAGMPGEAVEGKVGTLANTDAKIKIAANVKCYQTMNTATEVTECILKINTTSGEMLEAEL